MRVGQVEELRADFHEDSALPPDLLELSEGGSMQPALRGHYSYRNETMGSTLVARRAGK